MFLKCKIRGAPQASWYLGRPWRPYAKTVFLLSELSGIIKPEGWNNWNKPEAESTTFYAEYKNYGSGADTSKRVAWSRQLTNEQAEQYTLLNIFSGWNVNL